MLGGYERQGRAGQASPLQGHISCTSEFMNYKCHNVKCVIKLSFCRQNGNNGNSSKLEKKKVHHVKSDFQTGKRLGWYILGLCYWFMAVPFWQVKILSTSLDQDLSSIRCHFQELCSLPCPVKKWEATPSRLWRGGVHFLEHEGTWSPEQLGPMERQC